MILRRTCCVVSRKRFGTLAASERITLKNNDCSPLPVDREAIHNADDIGLKSALRLLDVCFELGLIDQSARNNWHNDIISRLKSPRAPSFSRSVKPSPLLRYR